MSDVDEHAEQQKQQQQQQQQLAQEGGYYNDGGIESDAISSVSSSMSFSDAVLVSQQQHQQRQHQQGTPPKTPSPVLPATTETPTTTAATSSPSVASSSFPSTPSVANLSSSAGQVQIMLPSYEEAMPWKTTTKPRRIVGSKPDEYLNVLVAGEAGLGKSTFIRSLFLIDKEDEEEDDEDEDDEPIEPTREITPVTVAIPLNLLGDKDQEGKFYLQWVDTPGYGDSLNVEEDSIKPVIKYLDDMYLETGKIFSESADDDLLRKVIENSNSSKKHIDLCFFFIAAHRIKEIDLKFMKILSQHITVVPLIAKADTMTVQELREFRQLVRQKIEENNIPIFDLNVEDKSKPPFAVISSRTLIDDKGSNQKLAAREYPWGTCMVENPQHSDVSVIRRLLLYSHLQKVHQKSADMFIQRRYQLKLEASKAEERARIALEEERKKPIAISWKAVSIFLAVLCFVLVAALVAFYTQAPAPVQVTAGDGAVTMDPFKSYVVGLPSSLPWPSTVSAQAPFSSTFDLYAYCGGLPCHKDSFPKEDLRVFLSSYGEQVQAKITIIEDSSVAEVYHITYSLDSISGPIRVQIWMGQSQIKDSPFEIPLPQQRRINVSGTGVQPEYELGKSGSEKLSINIDMRLLEQASSGMKSTQIMPDVSSPVPVKAWMSIKNDKGEVKKMPLAVDPNNWTISFKPPVAAEHTIEIRDAVSGEHINGSPFNIKRKIRGLFGEW